jgi:hypothetical protein
MKKKKVPSRRRKKRLGSLVVRSLVRFMKIKKTPMIMIEIISKK